MRKILCYFFVFCAILFTSCTDDSIQMGTVSYYPSFLWVDADTVPLKKTFDFDFSEDAKNADSVIFAEFEFVDNEGKIVSTDEMIVYVDGKKQEQNSFQVTSSENSKEIAYIFTPSAEGGKRQGYLKLVKHNLHRIDNQELSEGQEVDVFQWTIVFDKRMNPLKKILIWFCIALFSMFILWVLVVKKIFYPRFRAINKTVIIPNQAPISIRFKGARMVVIDNVMHKQSWWKCLMTGKIIYKQNLTITSPIMLMPTGRGRKILFKSKTTNYICSPNPIGIQPSKVTDIINNKQEIIIQ